MGCRVPTSFVLGTEVTGRYVEGSGVPKRRVPSGLSAPTWWVLDVHGVWAITDSSVWSSGFGALGLSVGGAWLWV